jgi:BON domain
MWLFDPEQGRRRRHVVLDRGRSRAGRLARVIPRTGRYLWGRISGIAYDHIPHPRDNPNPDDNTLRDRVESELLRDRSIPKGDLNINVADGIVELRGQLLSPAEIARVEREVRAIDHVRGVHNYLHVPGTPAPNKMDVLAIAR